MFTAENVPLLQIYHRFTKYKYVELVKPYCNNCIQYLFCGSFNYIVLKQLTDVYKW